MSVSSVSLNSDANVRYQKLASEYSKLRSQAKVLREGVLSERAKADQLTDVLKAKEAIIRKLETENESLVFRNEQLVKRVENLQNEVEVKSDGKKEKSSRKSVTVSKDTANQLQSMTIKIDLLEGELRNKLSINEQLVSQIAESDRIHGEEMAQMSDKFAIQLRALQSELDEMHKAKFSVRRGKPEISKERENKPVETVRPLVDERKISTASSTSLTPSPIPETCPAQTTIPNNDVIEISSPTPPETTDEAYLMMTESTKSVFLSLYNVFNLLQQRSEIYPYDVTMETLPKHVEKLSFEYAQCARLFSECVGFLESCLEKTLFEIDKDVPKVLSKIDLISKHCHTMLLELIKQMCEEESRVNWATAPIITLNQQWCGLMEKLFLSFTTLHVVLSEKEDQNQNEQIVEELRKLADVCTDLSSVFSRRWLHESRFPTTTRRMRCIGQALESSVQQLAAETGKLHARSKTVVKMTVKSKVEKPEALSLSPVSENPFESENEEKIVGEVDEPLTPIAKNISVVCENICTKCRCSAELAPKFSERATSPHPAKSEESTFAASVAKNEKIRTAELDVLRTRIKELQAERDKQTVDFSLLRRKYELANGNEKYNMSNIEHLREIGRERTEELVKNAYKAECGMRFYKGELEVMVGMHLMAEEKYAKKREELEDIMNQKHQISEELASVRRGYEAQIGELSEHVASLVTAEKERLGAAKSAANGPSKETISKGRLKSFFNKS